MLGALSNPNSAIEELRFDDGTTLLFAQMLAASQVSTDGHDEINGTAIDDTLAGGLGDDVLSGLAGSDTLSGEAGADILRGGVGDDILDGGAGLDLLEGGADNDTYIYNLGHGQTTIDDLSGTDRIEFGAGITPATVTITKNDTSLELRVAGSEDRLTILNAFDASGVIEVVAFDDGTEWNAAEVLARANSGNGW